MLLDHHYQCARCHRPMRADRLHQCHACHRFVCATCRADTFHMFARTHHVCRDCAHTHTP